MVSEASKLLRQGIEPHYIKRHLALIVAGVFATLGIAWILVTDLLLYELIDDPVLLARLEAGQQWVFVGFTTALLYAIAHRAATRLTRAHAALSAVVESIADGVLLLGSERTIVYANPAAARFLRCKHPRDLIGMDAMAFSRRYRVSDLDGALVPPDQFLSLRTFDEGGTLRYKVVVHPPGGAPVTLSVTSAAVLTTVEEPVDLVVSVMHDISESERLARLRDDFFAAAAHSLKTPVAIIHANAQAMPVTGGPRLDRARAAIERQCGRIDRLVQNLLVLARTHSRSMQFHPSAVDLRTLVERVVHEMSTASPDHSVRAEILAAPQVNADKERLSLVVRNLVEEAFRCSVPGTSVITRVSEGEADAEIAVDYEALPLEERVWADPRLHEYDDVSARHSVVTTIVAAHGGTVKWTTDGRAGAVRVRLPSIEGAHALG